MSFITPIGRVKRLGSSKHGFMHWWAQRLSAVLLLPLGLYVVFSLAALDDMTAPVVLGWIKQPLNAGLLLAFVIVGLQHARLGLHVVVEDYVHSPKSLLLLKVLISLVMVAMMAVALYSILNILFGS